MNVDAGRPGRLIPPPRSMSFCPARDTRRPPPAWSLCSRHAWKSPSRRSDAGFVMSTPSVEELGYLELLLIRLVGLPRSPSRKVVSR